MDANSIEHLPEGLIVYPASVASFVRACHEEDDVELAMSLVRAGQPRVNDLFHVGIGSVQEMATSSPLHCAVLACRVEIVRALAEEGADLNRYARCCNSADSAPGNIVIEYTAVGLAVLCKDVDVLSALRAAGAAFGFAKPHSYDGSRTPSVGSEAASQLEPVEISALQLAMLDACDGNTACLTYLLDVVGMDARMGCDDATTCVMLGLANEAAAAIPVFRMLVARGFDATALRVVSDGVDMKAGEKLLAHAAQAPDKRLLRYCVKELGITAGTSLEMEAYCAEISDYMAGLCVEGQERLVPQNLEAVSCTFCGKIKRTNRCSRCKTARYCSTSCQRAHWVSSHKRQCVSD